MLDGKTLIDLNGMPAILLKPIDAVGAAAGQGMRTFYENPNRDICDTKPPKWTRADSALEASFWHGWIFACKREQNKALSDKLKTQAIEKARNG